MMDTANLIETCDFINMDTSALMESDSLLRFLNNYGVTLIKSGRTIFVCREVIAELKVLSKSDNPAKRRQAQSAFDIIYDNYELFRLEDEPDNVDPRIVHKRIADQRIINAVTWYKIQHTQLFISNDKALLKSIIATDQMEAVHGKPVHATCLIEEGELLEYNFQEDDDAAVDEIITEMNNKYVDGKISGAIWGSLLSTVLIGGISILVHSRVKGAGNLANSFKRF